jgi:hypothetical protein
MAGQIRLTLWLAEQGSRTSRKFLRHKSRGIRTLDAPTAAPLNQCRGKGVFSEVDELLYDGFWSIQRVRGPNRT